MEKINHIQFVEDIAGKLGLTEEETVKKLTEFILTIKEKSGKGEVAIDGLGTFATKGKSLTFTPDESFDLEINHNYAGMMPVVIEEPKPETAASAAKANKEDETVDEAVAETDADDFEEEEFVDVIDDQDPFDLDDHETGPESSKTLKNTGDEIDEDSGDAAEKARNAALEAEEKKIKEEEEAARKAEQEAEAEARKNKEAAAAAAALAARKAEETEKARQEEEKAKKSAAEKAAAAKENALEAAGEETNSEEDIQPKWIEPEAETANKTVAEDRSDTTKSAKKGIPAYDRARPDSNTGTIIAILVAAVVVVAGALYFFGFLSGSQPSAPEPPVISEQTEVPPAVTEQPEIGETETGISPMEQLAEQEAARDVTEQPVPLVDEQTATPPAETQATPAPGTTAPAAAYGMRGTMNTTLQRPYTIVVHSLASRTDAERESSSFASAGFRSTYFRVELPNGTVRWRVAVGQFTNIDNAVEAASRLPEPYPANHFISRIESYNP
jgi:hypothetical protein